MSRYEFSFLCRFERDASGKLTPLHKPSVDTGMGLERVAAVMQEVHSNYENGSVCKSDSGRDESNEY
jgi:Alanyl-tRNA synthetase